VRAPWLTIEGRHDLLGEGAQAGYRSTWGSEQYILDARFEALNRAMISSGVLSSGASSSTNDPRPP
jgi:hypothetical protein